MSTGIEKRITVYSGYSGHVYSGHSDIVTTFPGTKYIYSFIFRSDIVTSRIQWPESAGPRWLLYRKCTVPKLYVEHIITVIKSSSSIMSHRLKKYEVCRW